MSHAFWDWSLAAYDRADVRNAALTLQDQHGLNVNICLWCAWLAQLGRDGSPILPEATARLEAWSADITQSLRTVRRQLKESRRGERLYKAVLACELDAEHVEQDILFDLADQAVAASPTPKTATLALDAYARQSSAEVDFTDFVKAVFLSAK
ncbi:TIGR02444 family protein [Hyphobacterium sp.]|uniref:TIGR02444 family protein n=1 Tax=Hyphobacterium sp. TaxID=2004662 RepID=UPI003B527C73